MSRFVSEIPTVEVALISASHGYEIIIRPRSRHQSGVTEFRHLLRQLQRLSFLLPSLHIQSAQRFCGGI